MMQSDHCKTVVVGFECANVSQIASRQQRFRKAPAQRPRSLLSKAFSSQQPSQWLEAHYSDEYETDDEFFESDTEHHSMQTLSSGSSSACSPSSSVSLASSEPIDIPYKRSPYWAATCAVAPPKPYAIYTAAQLQGQRFQGTYSACAQQAQPPHDQGHHNQHQQHS